MYSSSYKPVASSCYGGVVRVFDTSVMADYAINESGHIRSDFAVLNETNDRIALSHLLQRVEKYADIDVNKGKSLEEILRDIRPRMCETPAELDRFEQYCIENAIDFYKKLKDSEVAKLSTGKVEDSSTPVPTPAPEPVVEPNI